MNPPATSTEQGLLEQIEAEWSIPTTQCRTTRDVSRSCTLTDSVLTGRGAGGGVIGSATFQRW